MRLRACTCSRGSGVLRGLWALTKYLPHTTHSRCARRGGGPSAWIVPLSPQKQNLPGEAHFAVSILRGEVAQAQRGWRRGRGSAHSHTAHQRQSQGSDLGPLERRVHSWKTLSFPASQKCGEV